MKIILKNYPRISEVAHAYDVCGFVSLTLSRSVGTETNGFMFSVSPTLRVLVHRIEYWPEVLLPFILLFSFSPPSLLSLLPYEYRVELMT